MKYQDSPFKKINFEKAIFSATRLGIERYFEETQTIPSHLNVLVENNYVSENEKNDYYNLLKEKGVEGFQNFPVPKSILLPENIYIWVSFITSFLENVNARVFSVATEALGAKRLLARDIEGKIHELPSEKRDEYAMIQIGIKGKNIRTFAAPLMDCLVNKQGDYKRKIGEWHEYKNIEKLAVPTEWK